MAMTWFTQRRRLSVASDKTHSTSPSSSRSVGSKRSSTAGTESTLVSPAFSHGEKNLFGLDTKNGLVRCSSPVPMDAANEPTSRKKSPVGAYSVASLGLQTLVAVGESLNVPYLKGLASIVLLVVETAQTAKNNKKDCARISSTVLTLGLTLAEQLQKTDTGLSPQFCHSIKSLYHVLEKVSRFLRKHGHRRYMLRFFNARDDESNLQDCNRDLEWALGIFGFCSQMGTMGTFSRLEAEVKIQQKLVLEIIDSKLQPTKEQTAVANPAVSSAQPQILRTAPPLPPRPRIFYGRSNEVRHLLSALMDRQPAHVAVCGPGGIGKSSLALTMLHHPDVVHKFGQHRRFIACDHATCLDDLLYLMARSFGCSDAQQAARLEDQVLALLSREQSLIVLDNFEALWDAPDVRVATETFLAKISNIKTVSLITTLRGTQRPSGPDWTRPCLPTLRPLTPLAARETFLAISDIPTDDPNVDILLDLLDHHPLAVTLMAQLAQYESTAELVEQYNLEGTAMLSRGHDRRTSMDVSVELSLHGPRMSECPPAVDLLRILASFADGISENELSCEARGISGFSLCLSVLRQTSLVYEGDDRRLRVLAPVRTNLRASVPSPVHVQGRKDEVISIGNNP